MIFNRILHFILFLLAAIQLRADPFQIWYQTTLFHRFNDRWSAGSYFDLRLDDGVGDAFVIMASPRVKYDITPNLFAQINTSYIQVGNPAGDPLREHFRLEFELNPRFPINKRLTLSSRNRFENRWIEGNSGSTERIRIRPQVDIWTPELKPLRGVFANNEVFYDFDQRRITENRLTPFGLTFQPQKSLELRVYYLWRHTLFRENWRTFHALAILANVNF
jgi:hypothetical protein